MVRVKVRHVRVGVAGASGLMLLGNAAACVVGSHGDSSRSTAAADSTVTPGSGTITLGGSLIPSNESYAFTLTQSSTDEFVRVGEKLTIAVPAYYAWVALHPSDGVPFPTDAARVQGLKVSLTVEFIGQGDVRGRATLGARWSGTDPWSLTATSDSFTIPPQVDTLAFSLTVDDPADKSHVELASLDFAPVPVFGGELPLKHALFDNDGSILRQRIIEGGSLIAGASTILTYSDWRADEIVDRSMIDRQIGSAESYGRFGPIVVPIYGDIVYEITTAFSTGGGSYSGEIPLLANPKSRVISGGGRTAYETNLYISQGSTALDLYFHVKAYLVVDYSKYGNSVTERRYKQGDRILVREKWDNLNGVAYQNYELPVSGQ